MGKLPRRVMSMSKRAGKLVEDANALLHDAEEVEGDEEGDAAASPSALDEEDRPPAWAYVGAWVAMLALVIVVLLVARLIFASDGDTAVSLGVVPHGEPTIELLLSDATPMPKSPISRPTAVAIDVNINIETGGATIGGESVPAALICLENEAITYDAGGSLDCIPIDSLRSARSA